MKLLVTGICGRLGSAVAQLAQDRGLEVVGLDISPWPESVMPMPSCVAFHQGTYTDLALVKKLLAGCDALVHAGGIHGEMLDQYSASDYIDAHTTKLLPVLQLAQENGVKNAVLCSTMEVLVGHTFNASGAMLFDEQSPSKADTGYSLSRRLMEVLGAEFARQSGMSIATLRFMAFGYEDRSEGQWLLARSLSSQDAALAVMAAVQKSYMQGEVFNIGPDTPLVGEDIAHALAEPAAVLEHYYPGATSILEAAGQPIESKYYWPVTSIRKAQMVLGWTPKWTFTSWLLSQGWQAPKADAACKNRPTWKPHQF